MADNVQPDAGEQREESSGLLLSVDPLQGANNYKLAGDDGSDKGGLLGDDTFSLSYPIAPSVTMRYIPGD